MLLACTACTSAPSSDPVMSFASVGIDWPQASGMLAPADPPPAPAGFDDALFGRMADSLTAWAQVSTFDEDTWHGRTPADDIAAVLPAPAAAALREQTADTASPRLAVANVFADDVSVVGAPRITTAWRTSALIDDDLLPDSDVKASEDDLATFVKVGDSDEVDMPSLDDEQQVDAQYLQRCRDSRT